MTVYLSLKLVQGLIHAEIQIINTCQNFALNPKRLKYE